MDQAAYLPSYREFRPPRNLATLIDAVWGLAFPYHEQGIGKDFADRVLPDGCVQVICRLDDPFGANQTDVAHLFVRGPLARFDLVPVPYSSRYVGVRIAPGMASTVLRLPPAEIQGRRIGLRDLLPDRAQLFDRVSQARTCNEGCRLLVAAVAAATAAETPRGASTPAAEAVAAIRQHHGRVPLAALASRLGWSERTLHRRVTAAIGLSPKHYSRIVRLRHAIGLVARDQHRPLSVLALDAGYSDQAHMNRDFANLAGLSPATLQRVGTPFNLSDSSKTQPGHPAIVSGWVGVTDINIYAHPNSRENRI
jgi:AraC-like DNA-binding protein